MKNQISFSAIVVSILSLLTTQSILAQVSYQWAKSAGGASSDYAQSIAADNSGNVFITGSFKSQNTTFGTTTLANANIGGNSSDIYVAKYNSNGDVVWAKRAGGTFYDGGAGIATDSSGNIIVTGYFNSPSITFGTTTLTNSGSSDFFIVKYDTDGNVVWAKSQGGASADFGNSIATDAGGNILVTGYFQSPSITFGATTITAAGFLPDAFIVKYDTDGNALWAKSAGGTSEDRGNSICADASGNVLVTGFFNSSSITFGTTTLTNPGFSDIFIVKYDADGNVLWAKSQGGDSDDQANSIAADPSGNVLVTGYFQSPAITFGTTTLSNESAQADVFIVKYDASGNVLWAKRAGGASPDGGDSITSDASGNVLVTGYYQSPDIGFGSAATTFANAGSADIFIVKYDAGGNVLWAKSEGGAALDYGQGIAIDNTGKVLVTGWFSSNSIAFGTTTLPNTGGGNPDIFVIKSDNGPLGVAENYSNAAFSLYPNPASNSFTIELGSYENTVAELYNVEGVLLRRFALESQKTTVITDNFANGIYFLNLKTAKGNTVKKIVVKK